MCASHLLRIVDNVLPRETISRGAISGLLWRHGQNYEITAVHLQAALKQLDPSGDGEG
jgi:hypothetical protein